MSRPLANRLILLGWDAADWKIISPLVDAGLMPSTSALIDRGCVGSIATLQPPLSPILWTSIVTGKRAHKHGIRGFVEPTSDGRGIRPASSTSRTCKAIWNICHQAGMQSHAVGFFASHPAEPLSGVCVSNQFAVSPPKKGADWPMPPDAVHPERLRDPIRQLRVHPDEITESELGAFIPRIAQIDRHRDPRPDRLAAAIAKAASIQAVLTAILENEPWQFVAAYFDAIDVCSHHFMPFHPPKMPNVSDADFELYEDVIVGVYRFHDLMLGRVLELAGPDTAVIVLSDHGFHSDHLRPLTPPAEDDTPSAEAALDAAWHRPLGVICLAGPNIRKDERIYGATLLDVTPTMLTILGLPVGKDMDGKVLANAFDIPVEIERIESWDDVEGDAGRHPPDAQQAGFDIASSISQLVELGYIDPLSDDAQKNFNLAVKEGNFNLAASYLDAGRPADALKLLEPLRAAEPDVPRFATAVAQCHHLLGRPNDAAAILEKLVEKSPDTPEADLLLAAARFNTGRTDVGVELLRKAAAGRPGDIRPHLMLGSALIHLRQWPDAEASFRRAVQIDENNHEAFDGLSVSLLAQNRPEEAADAALSAVGILHHFPIAHMHLGIALVQMKEFERAIGPFELAVTMNPRLLDAHRYLATIFRQLGRADRAAEHRIAAERLMSPTAAQSH